MRSVLKSTEIEGIAQWEETVSAWMDGESASDWPDDLGSAAGRRTWDTYHLIGDVLRTTDLSLKPSAVFHARLSEALAREPAMIARPRRIRIKLSASGLAAALLVASGLWLARAFFIDTDAGVTVLAEAGTAPMIAPGLNDYLDAHWQVAGPGAVRYVSFDLAGQR